MLTHLRARSRPTLAAVLAAICLVALLSASPGRAARLAPAAAESLSAQPPPTKFLYSLGNQAATGLLRQPGGLALSPGGDVYVADTRNHRIQQFTGGGVFVRTWGSLGSAEGQLAQPQGLAVSPITGHVYVADMANDRVQCFTADGRLVTSWGGRGSGNGQLISPQGVAVSPDGARVYVADSGNNRVQYFTAAGSISGSGAVPVPLTAHSLARSLCP